MRKKQDGGKWPGTFQNGIVDVPMCLCVFKRADVCMSHVCLLVNVCSYMPTYICRMYVYYYMCEHICPCMYVIHGFMCTLYRYMCEHLYPCMYVSIYLSIYVYGYMCEHICPCMYVRMYVDVFMCEHMWPCMYVSKYVLVYICVSMHVS